MGEIYLTIDSNRKLFNLNGFSIFMERNFDYLFLMTDDSVSANKDILTSFISWQSYLWLLQHFVGSLDEILVANGDRK